MDIPIIYTVHVLTCMHVLLGVCTCCYYNEQVYASIGIPYSKTQPPELIFVVLNFVALDDCTHHAPFAIERKPSSNRHQSDRNREISSLIQCSMVKDTVNRLKMPDIEPCV